MRFKNIPLQLFVLLTLTSYVLYLGVSGQLNLYIHPRYVAFTLIMSAAALVLVLFNYFNDANHEEHEHGNAALAATPVVVMLALALLLPARTLTSATVSQRYTDAGSLVSTSSSRPIGELFAGSSRGLSLADWSRVLASNDNASYYANKPAKVSGFIYANNGDGNVFQLSRFVLTCCAVDAQPIGVPVLIQGWQQDFSEDDWLEIEGEFALVMTSQGEQLVLVPEIVKQIEEPSSPYVN